MIVQSFAERTQGATTIRLLVSREPALSGVRLAALRACLSEHTESLDVTGDVVTFSCADDTIDRALQTAYRVLGATPARN